METLKTTIFQIHNPLVKKVYQDKDNYKVFFNEAPNVEKDLCIVYFSSNDLYYPNTSKAFNYSILEKDRFEWQKNYLTKGYKHIFIRDVQKQWYLEGINTKIGSPKGLKEFIAKETEGFRVYALGSSAGGFAALLYGSLLNVERVYAFNAQLNLHLICEGSTAQTDPILFKYRDADRSKYFKIEPFINQTTQYFYFQSANSEIDKVQFDSIEDKTRLTRISFATSNHGFPFLRHNLPYVLGLDATELKRLSKNTLHPIVFASKIDGWPKTLKVVVTTILNRIRKKWKEKKARF